MARIEIEASLPKRTIGEWETDPTEVKTGEPYAWAKMCIYTEDIWDYFEYTGGSKKETVIRFMDDRPALRIKESFEQFHERLLDLELTELMVASGNIVFSAEVEEEEENTSEEDLS